MDSASNGSERGHPQPESFPCNSLAPARGASWNDINWQCGGQAKTHTHSSARNVAFNRGRDIDHIIGHQGDVFRFLLLNIVDVVYEFRSNVGAWLRPNHPNFAFGGVWRESPSHTDRLHQGDFALHRKRTGFDHLADDKYLIGFRDADNVTRYDVWIGIGIANEHFLQFESKEESVALINR